MSAYRFHSVCFVLGILFMTTLARPAVGDDEVTFKSVPAEHAVNMMTLSEDGKDLILAHKKANRISVWDVATGRHMHDVEIDEPHFLLSRRQYVFVLNSAKATLTPLSKSRDYKASRPFALEIGNPYFIAAPGGRFYKGQMLITGGREGSRRVVRVDTLRRSVQEVFQAVYMSIATVDYAGKNVIVQSEFSHSTPSSRFYAYNDFANPEKRKTISQGGSARGEYAWFYSVRQPAFWLSNDSLLAGKDLKRLTGGELIIGDEAVDLFYIINNGKLTAHRYDKRLTETGSRSIGTVHHHRKYRGQGIGKSSYQFSRPLAVTQKGRLQIYVHDARNGKVYRASTTSFSLRPPRTVASGGDATTHANKPKADDLGALAKVKPQAMEVGAMKKRFADAIVHVKIAGAYRRGMVVGARGYVLTRASGIDADTIQPTVNYKLPVGQRTIAMKGRGQIVHIDPTADIVLLKVDVTGELPTVSFAYEPELQKNTTLHIIGTGDGEPIESKIAQTDKRITSRQLFTVAPALPQETGGGPAFDANGQVLGMILHRDGPADETLIVPVAQLHQFLGHAVAKDDPSRSN